MHNLVSFVEDMIADRLVAFMLAILLETDATRLEKAATEWKLLQEEILSYPHKSKILRLFKDTLRDFVNAVEGLDANMMLPPYLKKTDKLLKPVNLSLIHPENLELFIPKSIFRTSVYGPKYVGAVVSKITKVSKYQRQLRQFLQSIPAGQRKLSQRKDIVYLQLRLLKECLQDVSRINTKTDLVRIPQDVRNAADAVVGKIVQKDKRIFVRPLAEMERFILNTEQVIYCLYNFAHKYEPNGKGERIMQSLYQLYEPYLEKVMTFMANAKDMNPIRYATELITLYKPIDLICYYMKENEEIAALNTYTIKVPKQKDFSKCFVSSPRSASSTNVRVAHRCLEKEGLDTECASIVSASQGFYFTQIVQNLTRWPMMLRELIKQLSRATIADNEKKYLRQFCKQARSISSEIYFYSPLKIDDIAACLQQVNEGPQQQALPSSVLPSSLRRSSASASSIKSKLSSVLRKQQTPAIVADWRQLVKARKLQKALKKSEATPNAVPTTIEPLWKKQLRQKLRQKKNMIIPAA